MIHFRSFASLGLCLFGAAQCQQTTSGLPQQPTGVLLIESNMDDVQILVDGIVVGMVMKGTVLRISGLVAGSHLVTGHKLGYEPVGPLEEIVRPGQDSKVTIRIVIPRLRRDPVPALFYRDGESSLARVTARALIQGRDAETPGYGLYTYLLFSRHSRDRTSTTYERYANAVKAYLEIAEVVAVRQYTPLQRVNITYLPIDGRPDDVSELLEAYDYARAQRILALLRVPYGDGPILLSTRQPLSNALVLPHQYLFQDLSTIPPAIVSLWVRHFIRQAAQERFWERIRRDEFVLGLRTYIAAGGTQVSDIHKAVATIIWQLKSDSR